MHFISCAGNNRASVIKFIGFDADGTVVIETSDEPIMGWEIRINGNFERTLIPLCAGYQNQASETVRVAFFSDDGSLEVGEQIFDCYLNYEEDTKKLFKVLHSKRYSF